MLISRSFVRALNRLSFRVRLAQAPSILRASPQPPPAIGAREKFEVEHRDKGSDSRLSISERLLVNQLSPSNNGDP
jgi:hypothetical protein